MAFLDHSTLSDDEAQRLFEEFVASAPDRIASLRRQVGDELLDYSPQSLVPVWQWFLARNESLDDRGEALPSWYLPDPPEVAAERVPPATLCDVDLVAAYLAEVFIHNVDGAHWKLGKLPKRMKYVDQNTPVVDVDGLGINTIRITYANALRARDGESTPDALLRTYEANAERIAMK